MRKRILILTQTLPALTGHGTAMRLGNILEVLARQHDVTLVCVSVDRPTQKAVLADYWRDKCVRVECFNVADDAEPLRLRQRRPAIRLLSPTPKLLATWPIDVILARLGDLERQQFDQVLISRLRLMPIWRALNTRLGVTAHSRVLDLDDIESRSQALQVRMLGVSHLGKIGYVLERLEATKLAWEERRAFREMDRVLICSREDRTALAQRFDTSKIGVVPNTIRVPDQLPLQPKRGVLRLLFVGTLNYGPNEHGVKWLVQAILPAIRARVGATDVTLTVIGRAPPDWMREQAAAGAFALHADVPDVKPFYDACDAVVVPISAGGGTRIKILEAFGYGRVVVSTTLGAEGIEAEPGKDFLIADSQSEFADAVVRLIETPPLGVTLVGNARKTVEQHYSMSACEHAVTMNFMLAGNGETRGVAMAHA